MKKSFLLALLVGGLVFSAHACFDTFLFQNKGSMVYPKNTLAVEAFGEYSYNSIAVPNDDAFLSKGRVFYGVSDRFSAQIGFGSAEKPRGQFAIDELSASGTFNLIRSRNNAYSLDGMMACMGNLGNGKSSLEVSAPSIFRAKRFVGVAHPVVQLFSGNKPDVSVGAHAGLFRIFENGAVLGIGTEYRSAQGGPYFSNRIVEGEAAASLFIGAMIGENLFIQNELAKGLANSRDFGVALTIKGVFNFNR
ncbi:hypothetical protein J7L01_05700 [bacterium]|nr:hypothetical protein [bacterium]